MGGVFRFPKLGLLLGGLACLGVLAAETLHATCGIHQLLLTGEEWMAGRADFNVDVAPVRRARGEVVTTGALHPDLVICWMNGCFHGPRTSFRVYRFYRTGLGFSNPGGEHLWKMLEVAGALTHQESSCEPAKPESDDWTVDCRVVDPPSDQGTNYHAWHTFVPTIPAPCHFLRSRHRAPQ